MLHRRFWTASVALLDPASRIIQVIPTCGMHVGCMVSLVPLGVTQLSYRCRLTCQYGLPGRLAPWR